MTNSTNPEDFFLAALTADLVIDGDHGLLQATIIDGRIKEHRCEKHYADCWTYDSFITIYFKKEGFVVQPGQTFTIERIAYIPGKHFTSKYKAHPGIARIKSQWTKIHSYTT